MRRQHPSSFCKSRRWSPGGAYRCMRLALVVCFVASLPSTACASEVALPWGVLRPGWECVILERSDLKGLPVPVQAEAASSIDSEDAGPAQAEPASLDDLWGVYERRVADAIAELYRLCDDAAVQVRTLSSNAPQDEAILRRALPPLWRRLDAAMDDLLGRVAPSPDLRALVVRRSCARALSVFESEPVYSGLRMELGQGLSGDDVADDPTASLEGSALAGAAARNPPLSSALSRILLDGGQRLAGLRVAQIRERRLDRLRFGDEVAAGDDAVRHRWRSREVLRVKQWVGEVAIVLDSVLTAASDAGARSEALVWRHELRRHAWPNAVPVSSPGEELLAAAGRNGWLELGQTEPVAAPFLQQRDDLTNRLIAAVHRWQARIRTGASETSVAAARAAVEEAGRRLAACESLAVSTVAALLEATVPPEHEHRSESQDAIRHAAGRIRAGESGDSWRRMLDLFPAHAAAPEVPLGQAGDGGVEPEREE